MLRFPTKKFSIILLSNLAEEKEWHAVTRNIQQIADLYLADHLGPASKANTKWDVDAKVVKIPTSELIDKTGTFQGPGGLFQKLTVKDKQLWWVNPFQHAFPLLPLGPTRFRSMASPVRFDLEFIKPKPDGPYTVKITQEDGHKANGKPCNW